MTGSRSVDRAAAFSDLSRVIDPRENAASIDPLDGALQLSDPI